MHISLLTFTYTILDHSIIYTLYTFIHFSHSSYMWYLLIYNLYNQFIFFCLLIPSFLLSSMYCLLFSYIQSYHTICCTSDVSHIPAFKLICVHVFYFCTLILLLLTSFLCSMSSFSLPFLPSATGVHTETRSQWAFVLVAPVTPCILSAHLPTYHTRFTCTPRIHIVNNAWLHMCSLSGFTPLVTCPPTALPCFCISRFL